MDAASVWVEYLREQAREMQWVAGDASRLAREMAAGNYYGAALYQESAHRAGIIAREAYRQWVAAVEAYRLRGLPMKPSAHDVRAVAAWAEMACLVADES